MGPRSIDRGIVSFGAVRSGADRLQWGRDLSIAELMYREGIGLGLA